MMKNKKYFNGISKVSLVVMLMVATLIGCNEETNDVSPELATPEIEAVTLELSDAEAAALGISKEEAAELSFTEAKLQDIISKDGKNKNARLGRFIDVSREDVVDLNGEVVGISKLVRFSRGIIPIFYSTQLEPNSANTLWILTFNSPENCPTAECGMFDIFIPETGGDLFSGTGRAVGPSGVTVFVTFLPANDSDRSVNPFLFGVPSVGLTNPFGAQVIFAVKSHGPIIPELLESQLTTFNGGCTFDFLPPIPELGEPGPNTCVDVQFAVHIP